MARVSGLLYERGANILHADQHIDHDLGLFFMRVELELRRQSISKDSAPLFAGLAAELGMNWKLTSSAGRPRVALFCSQYLHCMADLLHRWRTGRAGLRNSRHRLESSRSGKAGRILRRAV